MINGQTTESGIILWAMCIDNQIKAKTHPYSLVNNDSLNSMKRCFKNSQNSYVLERFMKYFPSNSLSIS